ncbi:MAG: carbohydrate kinase family protein [Candidatus Bathyarchaeia archaeon]
MDYGVALIVDGHGMEGEVLDTDPVYEEVVEGLARRLEGLRGGPRVAAMPDFFVDHFIYFDGDAFRFEEEFRSVVSRGGGDMPHTLQEIHKGGNAANMSYAVSRLGGGAVLLARTSGLGLALLRYFFEGENVDLSRVRGDGRLAVSTQLELRGDDGAVNVMIGDWGSASDFGPEMLTDEDYRVIAGCDYACVVNWSENMRGTDLAEMVFSRLEGCGAVRFFDPGDPSTKPGEVKGLFRRVLSRGLTDHLSLNENEFRWIAGEAGIALKGGLEGLKQGLRRLWEMIGGGIVDLHTSDYSASVVDGEAYLCPTFRVEPLRATGAGDAWNAASIWAGHMGLSPLERLIFANAAAGLYISAGRAEPPRLGEVRMALSSLKLRDLGAPPPEKR